VINNTGSFPSTGAKLLNVKETAEFLNVPVQTVYDWAAARRIPSVKLGRCLRFCLPDLENLIMANRREPLDRIETL